MDTRASTPQSDAEFASRLQAEEARAAGGAGADAVISMLNQFAAQAHARNAGLTLNAAALPVVTPRRNGTVAGNRGSWIEAATKTSPAMIIFATLVAMPQLVGIVWVLARTQCQYDDPKAHRNGLDRTCDSPLGIWLVLYAARLVAHLAVLWVLAVGHSMHVRRRVGAAARAEAGEETAASANPAASATQTAAPRQTRRYARVGEDEDEEEEQGVDVEQPAGTGREGDAARDVAVNAAVAANEAALRRTSHGACTTILIYAAGLKGARRSFLAIMTIIFTYFDDNFYIIYTAPLEMLSFAWFFVGILFTAFPKNCDVLCPSLLAACQYIVMFNAVIVLLPCALVVVLGLLFTFVCIPLLSQRHSAMAQRAMRIAMRSMGNMNGFTFEMADGNGRGGGNGRAAYVQLDVVFLFLFLVQSSQCVRMSYLHFFFSLLLLGSFLLSNGATQSAIDTATSVAKWSVSAEDAVAPEEARPHCAVCQEALNEGERVRMLPCQHPFHAACVDDWLTSNASCPVCRADIRVPATPAAAAAAANRQTTTAAAAAAAAAVVVVPPRVVD